MSTLAGMVDAEPLEWEKSKKFALIVFGFIGTLFSNITALQVTQVIGPVPVGCVCMYPHCPAARAAISQRLSLIKYPHWHRSSSVWVEGLRMSANVCGAHVYMAGCSLSQLTLSFASEHQHLSL